jgi:hypothetical protein
VKGDKDPTKYRESVTFTATVVPTVSKGGGVPTGTVQFILDGSKVSNPITIETNGRAAWSTSSLQVGNHQVTANYIPSHDSMYLASTSPDESHTVIEMNGQLLWVAILLIVIFLIFTVRLYLRM